MGEALHKLGIDWKMLLSQMVNFAILFLVLYKFLYKPVLKMLTERSDRIEKSIEHAEQIEAKLLATEKEREKVLEKAKKDYEKLLTEANNEGERIKKEILEEATEKGNEIIEKSKQEAKYEKDLMLKDIKSEMAVLVQESLKTVMKKDNKEYDKDFIKEAVGK